jgi:hypothetical protein
MLLVLVALVVLDVLCKRVSIAVIITRLPPRVIDVDLPRTFPVAPEQR